MPNAQCNILPEILDLQAAATEILPKEVEQFASNAKQIQLS